MEIRVLRYFLAIAREGSITNAANFLHVTQPTLSCQIRDLEEELGQKLFIRGSHNMTLTMEEKPMQLSWWHRLQKTCVKAIRVFITIYIAEIQKM